MNYREIDEVIQELNPEHWLFQQAVQPDYERIFLEFHDGTGPCWLVFVLKSPFTRLHVARPPLRRKGHKPRLAEFLNARLAGARLTGLRQLGDNRIVVLDLLQDGQSYRMIARLWNNAANLLVTDAAGVILDCFFRRPARQETSGKTFVFPESRPAGAGFQATLPDYPREGRYPFSRYLEASFAALEAREEHQRLEERGRRLLQELQSGLEVRIRKLETRITKAREHNEWKTIGDLLLANAWQLPKGAAHADLDDWRVAGKTIRIPLDPKLDAVQNAQVCYQRFQKDRDALAYLEDDLGLKQQELTQLAGLAKEFQAQPELPELQRIVAALAALKEAGKPVPGTSDQDALPGARFTLHGYPVFVGRNSRESDELLRHHVRGNDLWLHVRDYPGGYVFVRVPRGKTVPSAVLIDAAHLAAWYSKGKDATELDLYYTHVKYLRRAKNAKLGTVLPTQERNLHLRVEAARLKAILEPGT